MTAYNPAAHHHMIARSPISDPNTRYRLDDNISPPIQEKCAPSRKAGRDCALQVFEGCGHGWVAEPGPQTERPHRMDKDFIARQVRAFQPA